MLNILSIACYTCAAMSCACLVSGITILKGGEYHGGKHRVRYVHGRLLI